MKSSLFDDPDVQRWLRRFVDGVLDGEIVTVSYPSSGNKTPIAIVGDGAGRRAVVRLVDGFTRYVKLVGIQRQLVAWDLPVPALLRASLVPLVQAPRHAAIAESALPGVPWVEADADAREAALAPIAEALANFHRRRRTESRSLLMSHRQLGLARPSSRSVDHLRRLARFAGRRALDEIAAGLVAARRRAHGVPADALVHGRVNTNNFLIADDRSVGVCDLGSVTFGHVARDLVPAVRRLARWADHHPALFCDAYARVADVDVDAIARTWPLYEASLLLARCEGRVRACAAGRITEDECAESIAGNVEELRAVLTGESFVPWASGAGAASGALA